MDKMSGTATCDGSKTWQKEINQNQLNADQQALQISDRKKRPSDTKTGKVITQRVPSLIDQVQDRRSIRTVIVRNLVQIASPARFIISKGKGG